MNNLYEKILNGEIPIARLDDAVERVLAMKEKLGILDGSFKSKTYDEENKRWIDKDGIGFEPGPVNLMLEYGGKIIEGDLEDALKLAGKEWE